VAIVCQLSHPDHLETYQTHTKCRALPSKVNTALESVWGAAYPVDNKMACSRLGNDGKENARSNLVQYIAQHDECEYASHSTNNIGKCEKEGISPIKDSPPSLTFENMRYVIIPRK
jgi:hypothetical protein